MVNMTLSSSNVSSGMSSSNINNPKSKSYIPKASKLLKFFLMFPVADFIGNIVLENGGFDSREVCQIENSPLSSEIPNLELINCTALSTILNQTSDTLEVEAESNADFVKSAQKSMKSFIPSFLIYTAIDQVLKRLKG